MKFLTLLFSTSNSHQVIAQQSEFLDTRIANFLYLLYANIDYSFLPFTLVFSARFKTGSTKIQWWWGLVLKPNLIKKLVTILQ